jgi:hypothetical protein
MNFMHVAQSTAAVFWNHLVPWREHDDASSQNALPDALPHLAAPIEKLA